MWRRFAGLGLTLLLWRFPPQPPSLSLSGPLPHSQAQRDHTAEYLDTDPCVRECFAANRGTVPLWITAAMHSQALTDAAFCDDEEAVDVWAVCPEEAAEGVVGGGR